MESKGVIAIALERQRQINVEGFAAGHDDNHATGDLAAAAACYAAHCHDDVADGELLADWFQSTWPWDLAWWKPGGEDDYSRARRLVKAGALIAAELDRLAGICGSDILERR